MKGEKNKMAGETSGPKMKGNANALRFPKGREDLRVPLFLATEKTRKLRERLASRGITPTDAECRKACREIFDAAFLDFLEERPVITPLA